MKTLDYFTPIQNAELDIESLTKKYVCYEEDCQKIFFDQGIGIWLFTQIGSYRKH